MKVRKSTPDTFIATPEGNYIFAEHTRQESGLLERLRGSPDDCFEESKTGVPVEKVERVVFCFKKSTSLEVVLPFLAPDCSYDELAVGDETQAQIAYEKMRHSDSVEERAALFDAL